MCLQGVGFQGTQVSQESEWNKIIGWKYEMYIE